LLVAVVEDITKAVAVGLVAHQQEH